MRHAQFLIVALSIATASFLAGCSQSTKSPDVSDNVRRSLNQAGYKDVSVNEDRDKGVVTLKGTVASDSDKSNAESAAKSAAGALVVANEIEVRPPNQNDAGTINSDIDKGIDKNLDAALRQQNMDEDVKYDVKNGVVILKGDVDSAGKRTAAQKLAASVPNVQQVVNELQIKNRKATSTTP